MRLARHEVVYGTRTLSLADPVDAIVPADRALMPSGQRRVTAPNGLWTHAKAVGSPESRALAYAFLRDAPLDCPDLWDRIGPWIGRGIGVLERVAPFGIAAAEGRLAWSRKGGPAASGADRGSPLRGWADTERASRVGETSSAGGWAGKRRSVSAVFGCETDCDSFHKLWQGVRATRRGRGSCPRETKQGPRCPATYHACVTQNLLPVSVPGLEGEFDRVEVRRSARRRKTVSAEIVGNSLVVSVPARMSRAEESEWVRTMARRMAERSRRHRLNSEGALRRRAAQLAAEYLDGVTFAEFTYGGVDKTRWGWCDPKERRIRLSLALAEYPAWVRDYVIVHELAHLLVPDHSERFWALVNRYPLTERARGFLIAKGMEGEGSCG